MVRAGLARHDGAGERARRSHCRVPRQRGPRREPRPGSVRARPCPPRRAGRPRGMESAGRRRPTPRPPARPARRHVTARERREPFRIAHDAQSLGNSEGGSAPLPNLPPGRSASRRTAVGWAPRVRGEQSKGCAGKAGARTRRCHHASFLRQAMGTRNTGRPRQQRCAARTFSRSRCDRLTRSPRQATVAAAAGSRGPDGDTRRRRIPVIWRWSWAK